MFFVNRTLKNKLKWNLNRNSKLFIKMYLKTSSAKWRLFCREDELIDEKTVCKQYGAAYNMLGQSCGISFAVQTHFICDCHYLHACLPLMPIRYHDLYVICSLTISIHCGVVTPYSDIVIRQHCLATQLMPLLHRMLTYHHSHSSPMTFSGVINS